MQQAFVAETLLVMTSTQMGGGNPPNLGVKRNDKGN